MNRLSVFYPKYRILLLILIIILFMIVFWPTLRSIRLQYFDYNQFWTAGYKTIHQENPYLDNRLLYPPWVIPLGMPFSVLAFDLSRLLWYLLEVGLILFACARIWVYYNGPPRYLWLAWVVGISFSPAIFALIWGQLSPFIITGVILFLENMEPGPGQSLGNPKELVKQSFATKIGPGDASVATLHPNDMLKREANLILAGLCTYLIALKPQSLYLFWLAFLFWSWMKREWKAFGISLLSLIAATFFVSLFVPDILSQYILSFNTRLPSEFGTPTLGYWLRILFGEQFTVLQFVPPLVGVVWFGLYWMRKKNSWQWAQEMPVLAFASLLTTPHGWTHDYLILAVGILPVFAALASLHSKRRLILALAAWLIFNVVVILLHFQLSDFWFVWQIPFLLLFVTWGRLRFQSNQNLSLI